MIITNTIIYTIIIYYIILCIMYKVYKMYYYNLGLLIVYINLSLYNCILYWLVKQLICYYIIYLLYVIVYSLVISYLFIDIKCINIIYIDHIMYLI